MSVTILPPAQRVDPSARVVACENPACGKPVTIGDSHSFVITYATTGPAVNGGRIAAFGCESEQHFCCSQECARICAHACIDEHLAPAHSAKVTALQPATPARKGKRANG